MAFKFNVEKPSVKVMDRLELLQAQEELNHAFMDLTDAQKSMTEVCEVMENIQTSVNLITKYGAAGVEQLNVDGSLEALLQVPAKLITAEKATEGFGEAAKEAWKKFVEFLKKVWTIISNFFRVTIPEKVNRVRQLWNSIGKSDAPATEAMEIKVAGLSSVFQKFEQTVDELKSIQSNFIGTNTALMTLYNEAIHDTVPNYDASAILKKIEDIVHSEPSKLVRGIDRLNAVVEELASMDELTITDTSADDATVNACKSKASSVCNEIAAFGKELDNFAYKALENAKSLGNDSFAQSDIGRALFVGFKSVSDQTIRIMKCITTILAKLEKLGVQLKKIAGAPA